MMELSGDAPERFGRLVAQSIISVQDCLPALVEAAIASGYSGDRGGLRVRLAWRVLEAANRVERDALRVAVQISRATIPLLDEMTPASAVFANAERINELHGAPLVGHQVTAIVREEVAQWGRRRIGRRSARRRYAR